MWAPPPPGGECGIAMPESKPPTAPEATNVAAFEPHDHAACAADALAALERVCAERGVRLTPVRRRVMEMLLEEHRPASAYDLLERLRDEGLGSQPPSIYRALDFLIEQGFAHKLLRLNAFLGCAHPGEPHAPVFLICSECSQVGEIRSPELRAALQASAAGEAFTLTDSAIEIEGRCRRCAKA